MRIHATKQQMQIGKYATQFWLCSSDSDDCTIEKMQRKKKIFFYSNNSNAARAAHANGLLVLYTATSTC